MRSGTSRGVYLRLADLPAPGPSRDTLMQELIGSPDAEPVDGLGGGTPTTSKIMAVDPSPEPDADALSPPLTSVTCRNLNTGQLLRIAVPTDADGPGEIGKQVDAGVTRPAAAVDLFFVLTDRPVGLIGDPVVELTVDDVDFRVTMVDVGAPQLIVAAPPTFLDLTASRAALNASPAVLDTARRLRRTLLNRFAALSPEHDREARYAAAVPRLAFAAPVPDENTVLVRAMSGEVFHPGAPVSSAIALASATCVGGSVVALPASPAAVRLRHAGGELRCLLDRDDRQELTGVGVTRAVRRILAGTVFARALGAAGADDVRPVPGRRHEVAA